MNDIATIFTDSIKQLGQAFFVAFYLPASVLVIIHLYVLIPLWNNQLTLNWQQLTTQVELTILATAVASLLLLSLPVAVILAILNDLLIRMFEGKVFWLKRGLLVSLTKRNQNRVEQQAAKRTAITELRAEYRRISQLLLQARTGEDKTRYQQTLVGLGQQLDQEYSRIAREQPAQPLPVDVKRVAPTRFGNIYALAEEYADQRYGVNSVLFWPRLRQLMAKHAPDHSALITQQKTTLDLAINAAFVSGLLALEALLTVPLTLLFYPPSYLYPLVALLGVSGVLYVGFYYSAVSAIYTLGELIKNSFDYHRHLVLTAFNIPTPDHLLIERDVWIKLARFIQWGDEAYLLEARAIARQHQPVQQEMG